MAFDAQLASGDSKVGSKQGSITRVSTEPPDTLRRQNAECPDAQGAFNSVRCGTGTGSRL